MRDTQHNSVRGTAQGIQAPAIASPTFFTGIMSEEEAESITSFVAPVARCNVWEALNRYGEAVVQQAQGRQPFTPIRCHFIAGHLLPSLPPDFASGIWHTIDQVGARLYGEHF